MQKILFLDIDGVLNSEASFARRRGHEQLDIELMHLFDEIVERTGCKVVLSSSWRHSKTYCEDLESHGLNTNSFVDRTPCMPRPVGTSHEYMERGKEIAAWLEQHPEVERYAILDDDSDFLPDQPLFKTSWKHGLTREIAEAVIAHLNNEKEKGDGIRRPVST